MAEAVPIFGQQFRALGHRIKRGIKSVLIRGMLFEELGFMYIGPIDGHNIRAIKRAIEDAKAVGGPVLVHVVTTKGKGYAPAESNPELFHGTAPFDVSTGVPAGAVAGATAGAAAPDGPPTFTSAFGRCITAAARRDPRIMAVCAAMADGTGLAGFARALPSASSTWASRRSTPSPSPPGWRLGAYAPWWPSTPRSCSELTIR